MSTKNLNEAKNILKEALASVSVAEINVKIETLKIMIEELEQEKENYKKYGSDNYTLPLVSFLMSAELVFENENSGDLYCSEKAFITHFRNYCKENHLQTRKWEPKLYKEPFETFNIRIAKGQCKRYPNKQGEKLHTGTFLIGVDINTGPK